MNIVKLVTTNLDRYADHAASYRTVIDGQDTWGAYIKIGVIPATQGGGILVIEGFGPTEDHAAERAWAKAKMLADQMTFGVQEGFWGIFKRAEAAQRGKLFDALLRDKGDDGSEGGAGGMLS
jgi:hypothetical protein